jgi:hypothetical protein
MKLPQLTAEQSFGLSLSNYSGRKNPVTGGAHLQPMVSNVRGDCSDAEFESMKNAAAAACNGVVKCTNAHTCDQLANIGSSSYLCAQARQAINYKCYQGQDVEGAAQYFNNATNCSLIYESRCPTPSPQTNQPW